LVNTAAGFLVGMAITAIQLTPLWRMVLGPLAERLATGRSPVPADQLSPEHGGSLP
jgi:hypothetical protein